MDHPIKLITDIFMEGVKAADPYDRMIQFLSLEGTVLTVRSGRSIVPFDLSNVDKIFVIGAGKASAKMALAVEHILGDRISAGVISVKYGYHETLNRIEIIEAGHPIPDMNSVEAARRIMELVQKATDRTLVITLISGGGSALIASPISYPFENEPVYLTLDDKRETTKILLECGAVINEINCVRKHLSQIKGGRLAKIIYPAVSLNFILSDVVGDRLDAVASGLTVPDLTTFQDMDDILRKYDIDNRIPKPVRQILEIGLAGVIDETPKPGDPVFKNVHQFMIGTNYFSLKAAENKARALGFHPVLLTSQLTGEAREAAKVLCGIGKDIKKHGLLEKPPCCVIAGGETTVTIKGNGKGGRNQELALSFLAEIEKDPAAADGIYFLSASTDGNDGPTDAAGAFASSEILTESIRKKLSISRYLKQNDSYHFFEEIGGLLKTGPTQTNVCDLQIMLITTI